MENQKKDDFLSVRSSMLEKYNVQSSSSAGSSEGKTSSKDPDNDAFMNIRQTMLTKYSDESAQRKRSAVSDWAKRYDTFISGFGQYEDKRNGGFTRDASGGFSGEIDALMRDYGAISEYAGRYGLPNAQRYYNQLEQIKQYITDTNSAMAQFENEDAYNRYLAGPQVISYPYDTELANGNYQRWVAELNDRNNQYRQEAVDTRRQHYEDDLAEQEQLQQEGNSPYAEGSQELVNGNYQRWVTEQNNRYEQYQKELASYLDKKSRSDSGYGSIYAGTEQVEADIQRESYAGTLAEQERQNGNYQRWVAELNDRNNQYRQEAVDTRRQHYEDDLAEQERLQQEIDHFYDNVDWAKEWAENPYMQNGYLDTAITPGFEGLEQLKRQKADVDSRITSYERFNQQSDEYMKLTQEEGFGEPYVAQEGVTDVLGLFKGDDSRQKMNEVLNRYYLEGWMTKDERALYDIMERGTLGSWDKLTETEEKIYYYLLGNMGQEAAEKYLKDLETTLNARDTQEVVEAAEQAQGLEKAAYNAVATVGGVYAGIPALLDDAARTVTGKDINPYNAYHMLANMSRATIADAGQDIAEGIDASRIAKEQEREETKALEEKKKEIMEIPDDEISEEERWKRTREIDQQIKELNKAEAERIIATGDWGDDYVPSTAAKFASNTYQAVISGVQSAIGAFTLGGAYTYTMGMGAASERAKELYEAGASKKEILVGAVGSGVIESLFEEVSLEKFTENFMKTPLSGFKDFVLKTMTQGGVEASEEVATELANMVWDALNRGVGSDHSQRVRELMEQGDSQAEAKKQAALESAQDVFWAAYGGFVSGAGMGGIGGAMNALGSRTESGVYRNFYRGSEKELVAEARALNPENKQIQAMEKKLGKGKNLSGAELASLVAMNEQAMQEQNTAASRAAFLEEAKVVLDEKMPWLGADLERAADVLTKKQFGEEMASSDRKLYEAMNGDSYLETLSEDVHQENIRRGYESRAQAEEAQAEKAGAETAQEAAEAEKTGAEEEQEEVLLRQPESGAQAEAQEETGEAGATVSELERAADTYIAKQGEENDSQEMAQEANKAMSQAEELEERSKKYKDQAAGMRRMYREGQDLELYDNAFNIAYTMGKEGVAMEYAQKSAAARTLSPEQLEAAYLLGQGAADAQANILDLVKKVQAGDFKANDQAYLGTISDKNAAHIKRIYGIDVSGYKVKIEARQIDHILNRHGQNGTADHSMADTQVLGKLQWAMENAENVSPAGKTDAYVEFRDGKNRQARTVLYEKNYGDKSYYVVEAVPDTKKKTLFVVTAFIGEKGYKKESPQSTNAQGPGTTTKIAAAEDSSTILAQENSDVKNAQKAENDNRKEGNSNENKEWVRVREGAQWADGSDPGGQVSTVGKGTGGNTVRQEGAAEGGSGGSGQNQRTIARKVSSRELGIWGGTGIQNLTEVGEGYSDAARKAAALGRENGLTVRLYTGGNLEKIGEDGKKVYARAAYVNGNTAIVRADHRDFSPEQLIRHELGHHQIQHGEVDAAKTYERLANIYGEEQIDWIIGEYAAAYSLSGYDDMQIFEEIVCDAMADMNVFSENVKPYVEHILKDTKEIAVKEAQKNREQETQAERDAKYSHSLSREATAFADEIQAWNQSGRPDNAPAFVLGSTGETLQGLGAIESDIYILPEKINGILEKHPEMSIEILQKLPQILEDPILVMKTKTPMSRLVMYGSVKANNGNPVLAILDLHPVENGFAISDMQKVNSVYTKTDGPMRSAAEKSLLLLKSSEFLYTDKKRTAQLLRTMGIHAPITLQQSGYVGSIQYQGPKVNIDGKDFYSIFRIGDTLQLSTEAETAESLAEENKVLKKRLELMQQQMKVTNRKTLRPWDIARATKNILSQYSSTADQETVQKALQELGDYMANLEEMNDHYWEKLHSWAGKIAQQIVSSARVDTNQEQLETFKEIKKAIRSTKISLEGTGDIQDFGEFRKSMRGRMFFSKDGTSIDKLWLSLQDQFGTGYFPEDIYNPTDQIQHIAALYAAMEPNYVNPYQGTLSETVEGCANDIINTLLSNEVRVTEPTAADKLLAKEYDKLRKKLFDAQQETKRVRQDYTGRARKTELRHSIVRMSEQFKRMANAPQKANNMHAPVSLMWAVADFCDIFSRSEEHYQTRRADQLHKVTATAEALDSQDNRNANRRQESINRALQRLGAARKQYAQIKDNSLYALCYDEHIENMLTGLEEALRETNIYEMNIHQLEFVQKTMQALMHTVTNANKAFAMEQGKTITETAKKWHTEMDQASAKKGKAAQKLQDIAMWQMRPGTFFKMTCGYAKDNVGNDLDLMFQRGTERMLGVQQEFERRFRPLTRTEDKTIRKELKALLKNQTKNMVDWGLTDITGKPVRTPRAMMLQAAMLLEQKDSFDSIVVGGFKIPQMEEYYGGNVAGAYGRTNEESLLSMAVKEEYFENNKRIGKLMEELSQEEGSEGRRSTEELEAEINRLGTENNLMIRAAEQRLYAVKNKINELLTDTEKKVIQLAHEWYSYTGDLLNEVYLDMYGYEPNRVKNYVPIHRDLGFVQTDLRSTVDTFNLENSGFTKTRVKSKAPILLTDLFQELDNQQSRMSRYYGFAKVQRDFNKLYNTRMPGTRMAIKEKINEKFGSGEKSLGVTGTQYIENIIQSISGGNKSNSGWLTGLYSKAASATLSANLRVAVSQLASVPTAAAVVGWDNMALGFLKGVKTSFSTDAKLELAEKSVWFWQRYRGEGSMRELADLKSKGGVWNEVASHPAGKALFNWCQNMDVFATASMWAMAERAVQKSGIDENSERYQQAVKDKYAQIIRMTQPNYTDTERSDLLRDKREGMKLLTMYKTQSNQNLNILMEANGEYNRMVRDLRDGKNGVTKKDVTAARVKLANSWTAVTLGGSVGYALFRAAANFVMGALNGYRDEDKELTGKSVWEGILNEILGSLAGMFVLGGDVYTFFYSLLMGKNYYGMSDSAIGLAADFTESAFNAAAMVRDHLEDADENAFRWDKIGTLTEKFLMLNGVPAGNVKKWISAADMWYNDLRNGTFGSFEGNVERTKKQEFSRFIKAWKAGDKEKCDGILAVQLAQSEWLSDVAAEKELVSNIRSYAQSAYMDDTLTREEAERLLEEYTDETAEEISARVLAWDCKKETGISYGSLKSAYLKGKITMEEAAAYTEKYGGVTSEKAQETVSKWSLELDTGYSAAKEAYIAGAITADEVAELGGYTKDEAAEKVRQWQCAIDTGVEYGSLKEAYQSGEITRSQAESYRVKYGGYTKDEAEATVLQWQCKKDTGVDYEDMKKLYQSGEITRSQAESYRVKYGGYTKDEAESTVRYWKFQKEHPDLSWSEAQCGKFYNLAEPAGIRVSTYDDFIKQVKNCTGEDADGDGKTDSGSKKKQILEVIDKLPITKAQKDALYRIQGYGEKDLRKAPWNQ